MAAPASTYRLQIRQQFDLTAAAALADYLRELGAGAVYLSPILQATAGSDHGYDITSHLRVDPERGGEPGRLALVEAARANQLHVVVDIVPNHMGVADPAQNDAWWQLLKFGRDSEFAEWFDIDWQAGAGKVLLPVLGADADLAKLTIADGELRYYEHRFPIAPGTMGTGSTGDGPNGDGTNSDGTTDPAAVHERQHYRLVDYRRADTEQNYRRFFAVTDLAGIRVENPPVYQASHAEILRWVRTGTVDGIRIDHPDGLADPGSYLRRLAADAPDAWITAEKITEPGERLPADWPVAGTTGYDALAEVNALLYDPAAEAAASAAYRWLTGDTRDWPAHLEQGKRLVASTILQAELRRIGRGIRHAAPELSATDASVLDALTELAVAFEVYRSYHPAGTEDHPGGAEDHPAGAEDHPAGTERLAEAAGVAAGRRPELAGTISQIRPLLAGGDREVTVRFEQATGAIMAKGCEDTAYYRYNRAIGLNEVGGDPGRYGSTIEQFHQAQRQRQELLPYSMTTLSTHDTKRSEDVRARLAVLSELGERWYDTAERLLARAPAPNQAFGYLLWQTFAGAGWIARDRMHAYAEKAMREAADGTGWRDPDQAFEQRVHDVVDLAYDDEQVHAELDRLIRLIDAPGWSNSLSGKLIQLTMPGVPDVYQGTELFDYSLVDPDNRREVDFGLRRRLLAELAGPLEQLEPPPLDATGAAKLWLVRQALHARREHPALLAGYRPLAASGPAGQHAVAFDRGGLITVATRLPVTLARAGGWRDTKLTLPAGEQLDLLTGTVHRGGTVALAELLGRYPVALLRAA